MIQVVGYDPEWQQLAQARKPFPKYNTSPA